LGREEIFFEVIRKRLSVKWNQRKDEGKNSKKAKGVGEKKGIV